MGIVDRLLIGLGRRATLFLAASVFVGFAAPPLSALFRPLLAPALVFVLAVSLLQIRWQALSDTARRPWIIVALLVWLVLLAPVVMAGVVVLAGLPGTVAPSLLLIAAAPPITAVPAVALLLGLDSALAILTLVAANLLTPLILPSLVLVLFGIEVDIGVASLMTRLAALVGAAVVIAWLVRRVVGVDALAARAVQIDGLVVVGMLVLVLAIMDGVFAHTIARPGLALMLLAAAVTANVGQQLVGTLLFLPFGPIRALTAGLVSGNRNGAILLAALADSASMEFILFVALGQLPIYVLPALQRPIYRALLRR